MNCLLNPINYRYIMIYHDISCYITNHSDMGVICTNQRFTISLVRGPTSACAHASFSFHDFAETPKETNSHQRRPASNPGTRQSPHDVKHTIS